jgi:putative DNA methylase
MERELDALSECDRDAVRRDAIEAALDAGHGECFLKRPDIAELAENAMLHFDRARYRLLAWCVMPNHVHALIETKAGHSLEDILHSWKSFTSKEANRLLNRRGAFWMPEYHDRYIRSEKHLENALRYIEGNPVKAGLVRDAADWRFGSARRRKPMDRIGS